MKTKKLQRKVLAELDEFAVSVETLAARIKLLEESMPSVGYSERLDRFDAWMIKIQSDVAKLDKKIVHQEQYIKTYAQEVETLQSRVAQLEKMAATKTLQARRR